MKSNSFFSFSRFGLLMRNDLLLNYKKYLLTIAGAFILGFIFIFSEMPKSVDKNQEVFIFKTYKYANVFIMCLIGLIVFVGSSFSELSNKAKTTNYLLLPGSTLEKFLTKFVIYVIAGTLLFLIIFWIDVHLARLVAISVMTDFNDAVFSYAEKEKFIEEFSYSLLLIKYTYPTITYWGWFDGFAIVFGMFSAGMFFFNVKIFFKKIGLIKSIISFAAFIFFLVTLLMVLSQLFYPETDLFDVSNKLDYRLNNGYFNIEFWMYISAYFVSVFLIPLGYFKLKEKQL